MADDASKDSGSSVRDATRRRNWGKAVCWAIGGIASMAVLAFFVSLIYQEELDAFLKDYRTKQINAAIERIGSCLPPSVDRIELLHIEELPPAPGLDIYMVPLMRPHELFVVKKAELRGADAVTFADLWRQQALNNGPGAACHIPHHVLRFFTGSNLEAEIVICFMCANAAIPVWPGHELISFDNVTDDTKALRHKQLRERIEQLVGKHEGPLCVPGM